MRVERAIGSGVPGFADGDAPAFRYPQGLAFGATTRSTSPTPATTPSAPSRSRSVPCAPSPALAHSSAPRAIAPPARLSSPWDLALDGDTLHIAMAGIHQLWTLDLRTEMAAPFAGSGAEELHDGPHGEAALAQPMGLALAGDALLVADAESSAVREVDLEHVRRGAHDRRHRPVRLRACGRRRRRGCVSSIRRGSPSRAMAACSSATRTTTRCAGSTGRSAKSRRGCAGCTSPGASRSAGERVYVADTNAHRIAVIDIGSTEIRPLVIVE